MDFFALWGICSFVALGSAITYLDDEKNRDMSKPAFYILSVIFGPVVLGFMLQDMASDLKKIKDNTKSSPN
jgi:hypothetical protein